MKNAVCLMSHINYPKTNNREIKALSASDLNIRKNPADCSVYVNHLDVTIKRRGHTVWTGRLDDMGDFSCDKIESNKDPLDIAPVWTLFC